MTKSILSNHYQVGGAATTTVSKSITLVGGRRAAIVCFGGQILAGTANLTSVDFGSGSKGSLFTNSTGSRWIRGWYIPNSQHPGAGTYTCTFTYSASLNNPTLMVLEIDEADLTIDTDMVATATNSATETVSVTSKTSKCYMIGGHAGWSAGGNGTITASSGTIIFNNAYGNGGYATTWAEGPTTAGAGSYTMTNVGTITYFIAGCGIGNSLSWSQLPTIGGG